MCQVFRVVGPQTRHALRLRAAASFLGRQWSRNNQELGMKATFFDTLDPTDKLLDAVEESARVCALEPKSRYLFKVESKC